MGRNKLSSIHAHNIDLCLILRKARLFEADIHFLSNWLASEYLVKKGKEQAWLSELFHRTQEKYSWCDDSENIVISTVQVQWSGKTSRSTHECIQASVKTPQGFFHLRCSDTCHGKTRHYTIQDTLRGSLRLYM